MVDSALRNDCEKAHLPEGLLSETPAEPHVSDTKTKVTISRCELLTWLPEIIQ